MTTLEDVQIVLFSMQGISMCFLKGLRLTTDPLPPAKIWQVLVTSKHRRRRMVRRRKKEVASKQRGSHNFLDQGSKAT